MEDKYDLITGAAVTFDEALAEKLPLEVRPDDSWGNSFRVVVAAMRVKKGVIILDPMYLDVGSFPAHFIPGTPKGNGPWKVGKALFQEIEDGGQNAWSWNAWLEAPKSYPERYNDETARRVMLSYAEEMRLELPSAS